MSSQHSLTIVTPIIPEKKDALRTFLNAIGTDIDGNPHLDFYALGSVHFMRWVIVEPEEVRGEWLPAQLVWATNFDGPEQVHLDELLQKAGEVLRKIYSHCEGFPTDARDSALRHYLLKHKKKAAAFYVGKVGKNVAQVRQEQALRDAIQDHLQESNPSQNWSGSNPAIIQQEIQDAILNREDFAWASKPWQPTFLQRWGRGLLLAVLLLFVGLIVWGFVVEPLFTGILLALLVSLVAGWWTLLRSHEDRDKQAFVPPDRDPAQIGQLTQREDYKMQNQISHLVTVKPGRFRLYTLRFVLWAINLLARTVYNRGNLGGIPSIHFARWVFLDQGKRLLFFSNYDGSWESYLGTFVDKAANGLTGVWSHTEGFPPTHKLILGGARNSEDFKAWVRQQQIETQVWYSAYKTITVLNATQNTEIRNGFSEKMDEQAALDWLQKL